MRNQLVAAAISAVVLIAMAAAGGCAAGTSGGNDTASTDGSTSGGDTGSGSGGKADAGSGADAATVKMAGTPAANAVIVDPSTTHQPIDGFGAADVWGSGLTPDQGKLFFDPVNGIGLSLLRIGIEGNGTPLGSGAASDAMIADSYGAKVWAAPWSPPAADKSNDDVNDGGTLDATDYTAWATTLAGFPAAFKSMSGVQLYAISAQNEPDYVAASYESCIYTAPEMVAFVNVLGPMLAALDPPVNLLAAEPDSWDNLWSGDGYGTAILADPGASKNVTILATHDYSHKTDSIANRPVPPSTMTQHLWETEMSDETAADVDIAHGIQVATWVHAAMTTGGASAWHYWWLINLSTSATPDGEGLLQPGGDITSPPKRLYTLGNFSKFVRPGYVRIDVGGTAAPTGVLLSAYFSPVDGSIVVVAINSNTSDVTVPLFFKGASWPDTVTPWVTSATDNLTSGAPIALSGGNVSATLAAQTVTTFVGKASPFTPNLDAGMMGMGGMDAASEAGGQDATVADEGPADRRVRPGRDPSDGGRQRRRRRGARDEPRQRRGPGGSRCPGGGAAGRGERTGCVRRGRERGRRERGRRGDQRRRRAGRHRDDGRRRRRRVAARRAPRSSR